MCEGVGKGELIYRFHVTSPPPSWRTVLIIANHIYKALDSNYDSTVKPWPNGLASQRKFAKAKISRIFNWLMRFYNNRLFPINLCQLALGGRTVKNFRLFASKFELEQSQRKSTQVVAS